MVKVRSSLQRLFQWNNLFLVESGRGRADSDGELPQLYPWHAQVWRCLSALGASGYVPLFRHLGPTHATDPILLHEINKFPDEAKVEHLEMYFCRELISDNPPLQKIIQKCGGYRNFILRSKVSANLRKVSDLFLIITSDLLMIITSGLGPSSGG